MYVIFTHIWLECMVHVGKYYLLMEHLGKDITSLWGSCHNPSKTNMTMGKKNIEKNTIFNRRYIFKWLVFLCHVSFPGCKQPGFHRLDFPWGHLLKLHSQPSLRFWMTMHNAMFKARKLKCVDISNATVVEIVYVHIYRLNVCGYLYIYINKYYILNIYILNILCQC